VDRDIIHPQWISLEDALPGVNEKVVVFARTGGFERRTYTFFGCLKKWDNNQFSWEVETWGGRITDVLGWCPLPRDGCKIDE